MIHYGSDVGEHDGPDASEPHSEVIIVMGLIEFPSMQQTLLR